ncbi:hypothetical protein ES332_D11G316700v1 [Gossypium tomentosum]|uniref:Uncharacterized protein n=1 Tax=Gossypium tomentosum TaxID=34277 RepID=A0A5D2IUR9_GOSTO|nr:hypothetical protein ES332_D11G316700v1 [Gossypium tomentosum]
MGQQCHSKWISIGKFSRGHKKRKEKKRLAMEKSSSSSELQTLIEAIKILEVINRTDHAPCNWRDLGWEWNFRKKRIQDSGTRDKSVNLRAIHVSVCSPIIMNHPTWKLLLGGQFEIFKRRGDNIYSRTYCRFQIIWKERYSGYLNCIEVE